MSCWPRMEVHLGSKIQFKIVYFSFHFFSGERLSRLLPSSVHTGGSWLVQSFHFTANCITCPQALLSTSIFLGHSETSSSFGRRVFGILAVPRHNRDTYCMYIYAFLRQFKSLPIYLSTLETRQYSTKRNHVG